MRDKDEHDTLAGAAKTALSRINCVPVYLSIYLSAYLCLLNSSTWPGGYGSVDFGQIFQAGPFQDLPLSIATGVNDYCTPNATAPIEISSEDAEL